MTLHFGADQRVETVDTKFGWNIFLSLKISESSATARRFKRVKKCLGQLIKTFLLYAHYQKQLDTCFAKVAHLQQCLLMCYWSKVSVNDSLPGLGINHSTWTKVPKTKVEAARMAS